MTSPSKSFPKSSSPDRLNRFRREAQVLASLNRPHIAALHGLEESEGRPFLVLELVEGVDLSEKLSAGAIPLEEALAIALQVAEALEEAHANPRPLTLMVNWTHALQQP